MDENKYQQPQYQQPQYQQPQYQQPQYQQQQYQYQYQYQYQRVTSGRATAAVVLGIVSIVTMILAYGYGYGTYSSTISSNLTATALTCGVLAIILGAREMRDTKSKRAMAGMICGIIGVSVLVLRIVAILFLQLFNSVL